jgi:hypothetical protein
MVNSLDSYSYRFIGKLVVFFQFQEFRLWNPPGQPRHFHPGTPNPSDMFPRVRLVVIRETIISTERLYTVVSVLDILQVFPQLSRSDHGVFLGEKRKNPSGGLRFPFYHGS